MTSQDMSRGATGGSEGHTAMALNPPVDDGPEANGRRQSAGLPSASAMSLARGLGWFSIGLGLAAALAPRRLARLIGIGDGDDACAVLRAVGLREVATGVGILSARRPAGWLFARAGGDAMDLALLGSALKSEHAQRDRLTVAAASVAGIMALDLYCGEQLRRSSSRTQYGALPMDRSIRAQASITVNRPPEALYAFWHHFENLPRFMAHLEAVQTTAEKRSHWKAKAPAGMTVEWDAEIIADRPHELIAWRSLEGADVDNAGSVRFKPAPGGRGTEVRVEIQYIPPGGILGATFAKLFGEAPDQQLRGDLRRFKQVMEVGEVVHSEATAQGRGPARPAALPAET